jgi:O-antigen/teichoic acid export membrane protein
MDYASAEKPAASMRTDTLADSVLILLSLTVVQRLVGFLRAVLFCRWLDAEQLGQWDLAFSFLVLAGPLVVLALPAAFGRYVEHYRQRSQLRTFVWRSLLFCAGLSLTAAVGIYAVRGWLSELVFGSKDHTRLMVTLALSLVTVVAFNFSIELFTALRNVRLVSILQLVNSLVFATLGVALMLSWQNTAQSVVLAYGGACLVSMIVAMGCLRRSWSVLPQEGDVLSHRELWSKVIPFAGWVWTSSLLSNLFDVADRYMIVHWSPATTVDPLAVVGQYHSSRVVPLLLVSVATMLGSMMTPHLSCDWEAGRRDVVSARLNLFLKLMVFSLTLAAVGVLLAAPLLFGVAFQGKFQGGQAVLPWTLTYCIWFAALLVAQNYLWCAEKARLGSVALLVGLGTNLVLNSVLLPRMGLHGAVLATSAANLLTLMLILGLNRRLGFRTDRGTWIAMAAPMALPLGPWVALLVLGAIALEAIRFDRLLSPTEKQLLAESGMQYLGKIRRIRSRDWALGTRD